MLIDIIPRQTKGFVSQKESSVYFEDKIRNESDGVGSVG
jgi:hypothetical protein